jgi:general secretion pathway protein L
MTQVLLRLLPDGRSEWRDADGTIRDGWPPPQRADRVVVLVPAEDVLLLDVARIAGSERQWSQALPFVVEEQLVLPIESQHVAWWRGSRDDRICVAVVARARLEAWLAQLHAAGVAPDILLPESLALPWNPERPTLLVDGERCVLRLSESSALAGDPDEIVAFAAHAESLPAVDAWRVGDASSPLPAQEEHVVAHALHAFGMQPAGLNLLQGDYVPRGRSDGLARRWRRAAVLVGIALLLALLHPLLDRHKLAGKVIAQRAEMQQLYRRAVPSATTVDDPARQLQSALAARGLVHGDGLMGLLAQVAPALAADDRLALDALEYRERRLELVVQAGSVADLDGLRQRLARSGINAEIADTTPGTRGVQGRLRLGADPLGAAP